MTAGQVSCSMMRKTNTVGNYPSPDPLFGVIVREPMGDCDGNTSLSSYETIEEEVTVSTYEEQQVSDDESWETLEDLDLSSVYTTDEEEIEWSEYETASESDGSDIIVVHGDSEVVASRKKKDKSDASKKGTKTPDKTKKPCASAPSPKSKANSKSFSKNQKDAKTLKGKLPSSDKRKTEDDKDKEKQEKEDDEDESESSSGGNESDDDSDIPPPVKYGKCKKLPKDTPVINPKNDPVYKKTERMKWSTKDYCPGFKTKEELFPHRYKNKKAITEDTKQTEPMKQKKKKMRRVVHKEIIKTRRKVERKEPQKVRKKKEKPPKIVRVRKEKKIFRKTRVKKERVNNSRLKPLHSERTVSNTSNNKSRSDSNDGRIVQRKDSPVTATIDLKPPASKESTTAGDLKESEKALQVKGQSESTPKNGSQSDAEVKKQTLAILPAKNERKNDEEEEEAQEDSEEQKNMKQSQGDPPQSSKKDDDESEELGEEQQRMKQTQEEAPPRMVRKKDDEKKPRELTEERKRKCYMWYARLGQPHRAKMKERVQALNACDITPEEVDMLPWIAGGTMLSVKEMNKLFLDRSTDIVTYKYKD